MALKKEYPWNVLLFPAASEVGFEINRALGSSKEVIVHGANQPSMGVASFRYRNLYDLPPISDQRCLPLLQEIIAEHEIDAIFPTHDDVLLWLAERGSQLKAEVITSSLAACRVCRSKRATYQLLEDLVLVPKIWAADDASISFPVFVKPDRGQGSLRARRVDDRRMLQSALEVEPDLLVTEYLPGKEYTVDCFSQGEVLFAQARERVQSKIGISTFTRFHDLPSAREFAQKISSRLHLRGAWFFQFKENTSGDLCLLEVAPRIAGGMALSRITGPNFPLLSLYDAAGHTVEINAFETTMSMGRSFDTRFSYDQPIGALYVDLDDTLILRGEVNTSLVALIFQCRNRRIPVHLLTHHQNNLEQTLVKFRLNTMFDSIIHLPEISTSKADFIVGKNVVVIDDSFRERRGIREVHKANVRCFDAAGAACLLDERR